FLAGTATLTPVFGFRPMRAPRSRSRKEPKPRSSIFCPSLSDFTIASKTVSTIVSACFLVTSVAPATPSISSAFVISPSPARPNSTLGNRVLLLPGPLLLRGGVSFRFSLRRRFRRGRGGLRRRRLGRLRGGRGRGGRGGVEIQGREADLHLTVVDPED